MWTHKKFKTKEAMQTWLEKHEGRIEWQEVYVNNAYGLIYRYLRII